MGRDVNGHLRLWMLVLAMAPAARPSGQDGCAV